MTRTLPPLEAPRLPARSEIVDTTLSNGLRVVVAHAPSVPMVDLRLRVPVAEHPARLAALHVAAEAMFSGADDQGALGEVGGSLHAGLDPAWFTVAGSAMVDGLSLLLDRLAAALTAPEYDLGRCEAAADRLLARLAVTRAQPHVFTQQVFRDRFLPPGTPPVVPADAAVRQVTAESVTAAHHEVLRPTGAFLVVAGAVDPERVVARVATALDGWRPGAQTHLGERPRARFQRTGVALAVRPAAVQSQILLAAPVPRRDDPRFVALNLAACVFGGYFSSRLVSQVRGRAGLAYRAAAVVDELFDQTLLVINVDTAGESTAAALSEIERQLLRLADEPPTQRELDMAKSFCCGMLALQLSSQAGMASELTSALSFGFDPTWLWRFTAALLEVDVEAAGDAAATWFSPARFAGVVTGDVAALTGRRFGDAGMT